METRTINIKTVLLGEAAVGKSSIVLRFVNDEYHENKEPTIGAAFLTRKATFNDQSIKFEVWDTAGQERFHSLAPMYYRNAQTAIIVYDITNYSSLQRAKDWVAELMRNSNSKMVIAFVGNKHDLEQEKQVDSAEVLSYCEENGLCFFEVSAKSGLGIEEMFYKIGEKVLEEGIRPAERPELDEINFEPRDPQLCGC